VTRLLAFAAMMAVSGCRYWYTPVKVANAIGEEKILFAGDTMRVYRDARFEVYGPNPEAVYDGYEQLNRAYRAFERHFGTEAPRLAVLLANDTLIQVDSAAARAFAERGYTFFRYIRRGGPRRVRYGTLTYGGVLWPVAPTAARMLLTRFALAQRPADSARVDSAVLARFPVWYRAAVMHLVGEAGAISNDVEYLREQRNQWLALNELVTLSRAPSSDSALDPSRRSEADDLSRVLAAQSSTVAQYLVEREGPEVLRRLAQGYLAKRSFAEMLAEMPATGRRISELEQRWKIWLETQVE
jgi:hypothetical protein